MTPRKGRLGGQTPEQVQALLDQGLTQRALAERVGVTHQAVSRFVRRHGLLSGGLQAYRSRQADQVAQRRRQVRQLLKDGRTSAQMAALLGTSTATVSMDLRALSVSRALKGPDGRSLRGLGPVQVQTRLKDVSRAQLARELGVSSSAVYLFCKKAGLPTNPSAPISL